MFITFEGGEGTGKSTQIKLLHERLITQGRDVVMTREPGGTPQGEIVRSMLVAGQTDLWSSEAEALLNYAARDAHLNAVIRPALAQLKIILSDRFMDSTRAYQGYAGTCSLAFIDQLEKSIVKDTVPDLTFIFILDPSTGLARAAKRGGEAETRFERKGLVFHENVAKGFQDILLKNARRCRAIDANQSIDDVAEQVWAHVIR